MANIANSRRKGGGGGRKHKQRQKQKRSNLAWSDIVKKNELFENYYKQQNIVPLEEWDLFLKYCRRDLPSTFRITKIRGHAKDLLRSLREGYISKISDEDLKTINASETAANENETVKDEEESLQDLLLEPIKWYPNNLAWNSNLSRRFLRRSEILQKLHRFLVEDSECGAITRQEAVSMIPPMLLDVKPHHLVLDMCAAPGSKTAQIIEMMHDDENQILPTGVVIANDSDHKRCYLLTHQANRLKSPCVIITNHDASIFPKLYTQNRDSTTPSALVEFDRILCDVPCSGDGTIRKNPVMWHKWTPHLGTALHRLQMRILTRGLELLKVGGRLVYSTCSFNPIENEAVLAAVLSKAEGTVKLVDCSNDLKDLKRQPGMTNWKVFSRKGKEYQKIDDVEGKPTEGYKDTMFPPTKEEAEKLNLKYCMRIFPHIQNTGGFFIAVLEKNGELPWQKAKKSRYGKLLPWEDATSNEEKTEEKSDESNDKSSETEKNDVDDNVDEKAQTGSPPKKRFRRGMIKEDPYVFLDDTDKELANLRKFYDLSMELPSHQFLVRNNQGKKRHIYLVSESIHKIMSANENLKVINTGLRVVSRTDFKAGVNDHGVPFRLVQDGVHLISNFIKNRIITIPYGDLITLATYGDTSFENLSIPTKEKLNEFDMGCVVWYYPAQPEKDNVLTSDIWLCGHYGKNTVQCMISKDERKHFIRLLGIPMPADLDFKVKGPGWGDGEKKEENKEDETEKDEDMEGDVESNKTDKGEEDVSN